MEHKCFLETRGESFCSESAGVLSLIKLSDCRSNIDDQLRTWHLSQFIGFIQEFEIILNRLGLPHDLSPEQLEGIWICDEHRSHFGKKLAPATHMPVPSAFWSAEAYKDKKRSQP